MAEEPASAESTDEVAEKAGEWSAWVIRKVLYPFLMLGAPVTTLALVIYLLIQNFLVSAAEGIQSFTAVLLPLTALTYVFIWRKPYMERAGRFPWPWAFFGSFALGFVALYLLLYMPDFPGAELVMSSALGILVFSYAALKERAVSYYFGMVLGALGYVVIWGIPV